MKKSFFALSLYCLSIGFSFGQIDLPENVEAYLPECLSEPILKESQISEIICPARSWGQKNLPVKSARTYWTVFSDRANNKAYESPNEQSKVHSILEFNEEVVIAKIQNNFALVFSIRRMEDNTIDHTQATARGWVPMRKLLLWNKCLANDRNIYMKALLVANLDYKEEIIANKDSYKKVFKIPSLDSKGEEFTPNMNFYYVMKEENNMVLLSFSPNLSKEANTNKMLFGWVRKSAYISWNERSCIEPNWDVKNASKLGSVSVSSADFKNTFYYGQLVDRKHPKSPDRFRIPGNSLRYPILDNQRADSAETYRCTTFGMDTNLNKSIQEGSDARDSIQRILQKMQILNLIIVIDGTKSMNPYFDAVKEAVIEGCKSFRDNYKPRVGVVIYRDFSDDDNYSHKQGCRRVKGINGSCEILPVRDFTKIEWQEFLRTAGKYGVKSDACDPDYEEALFNGLNIALDTKRMGYNKDESNFLLLVGDCGNRLTDNTIKKEDIAKKMAANNIQLMSFQVFKKAPTAWRAFNNQMREILLQNVSTQYSKNYKGHFNPDDLIYKEVPHGYDLVPSGNVNQFIIGSLRRPHDGQSLSADLVKQLIDTSLVQFGDAVQRLQDLLSQFEVGVPITTIDTLVLKKKLGEKVFRDLMKANMKLAYTGYTPKKKSENADYWVPVLFIGTKEFSELIDGPKGFSSLMVSVNKYYNVDGEERKVLLPVVRVEFANAIIEMLHYLLPGSDTEALKGMDPKEYAKIIYGMNVPTEILSRYSYKDLCENLDNEKFEEIFALFKTKYDKLLRINENSSKYDYTFHLGNESFLWLPINLLP